LKSLIPIAGINAVAEIAKKHGISMWKVHMADRWCGRPKNKCRLCFSTIKAGSSYWSYPGKINVCGKCNKEIEAGNLFMLSDAPKPKKKDNSKVA
jgi:hypothetical protein